MKRPWQIWLVYLACVFAAAAGMAWLTRQALEADRLRRAAEADAELEQRVSLALWRMDTELAPIIAEEVIRPATAYRPGATVVQPPPYVLLQFEASPYGAWESPQATNGKAPTEPPQLGELKKAVELPQLLAELPNTSLPAAPSVPAAEQIVSTPEAVDLFGEPQDDDPFGEPQSPQQQSERPQRQAPLPQQQAAAPNQFFAGNTLANPSGQEQVAQSDSKPMKGSKVADFEQRNLRYQAAAQQGLFNRGYINQAAQIAAPPGIKPEQIGVSRPLWIGDRLLLVRRVSIGDETRVQGAWLDWPRLKSRLLEEASDTLPKADLVPAKADAATDPGRMLAGLPVRLVVNEAASTGGADSTLRTALWLGWGAVVLAVSAAAVLLAGVMTLSERRAAFVSSVTHELRTPLTTFRMYAEMLARGMVPDAARRQEYFETLQRESERLTLLVENVLAYARLERGRKPNAHDRTTLAKLLNRIGPRLVHRAAQADMRCEVTLHKLPLPLGEGRGEGTPRIGNAPSPSPLPKGEGALPKKSKQALPRPATNDPLSNRLRFSLNFWAKPGEGFDCDFTTDVVVVEQILFNLVDNAAKYARGAVDRRIHVEAGRDGTHVRLTVRDHGPGIDERPWSRRMRPFGKTAQESADSAPGVGLGLALCRRLAKQLGGRLEIDSTPGGGATITLLLPVTDPQ